MTRSLAPDNPALSANASWSITGWLRPTLAQSGDVVIAAVGGTRRLALADQRHAAARASPKMSTGKAATTKVSKS